MGEFFKTLRRKVEVVTLIVACVFMGGWVRGPWKTDQLFYLANTQSLHVVFSCRQGFGWTRLKELNSRPILGITPVGMLSFESMNANLTNGVCPPSEWSRYEWYPKFVGVRGATYWLESPTSRQEVMFFLFPHGMLVIPLTFLSAFLLIPKPCRSTPKKLPEPISNGRT